MIGSGFIGCEAAASLAMRGLDVTLMSDEPVPQAARLGDRGRRADRRLARASARRDAADGRGGRLGRGPRRRPRAHRARHPPARRSSPSGRGSRSDDGRIVTDERMRTSADGVLRRRRRRARPQRRRRPPAAGRALGRGARARRGRGPRRRPAERPSGARRPASGRRSATARSSTSPGATASTRRGWSSTPAAPSRSAYGAGGVTVGVLAHERDEDYERGRELVEQGRPLP